MDDLLAKTKAALVALLLLAGCAEYDRAAVAIGIYGAESADREMKAAHWAYCKTVTSGALQRRFKNDRDGWVAYMYTCWRKDSDMLRLMPGQEGVPLKPPGPAT